MNFIPTWDILSRHAFQLEMEIQLDKEHAGTCQLGNYATDISKFIQAIIKIRNL